MMVSKFEEPQDLHNVVQWLKVILYSSISVLVGYSFWHSTNPDIPYVSYSINRSIRTSFGVICGLHENIETRLQLGIHGERMDGLVGKARKIP
jgi:hypothetical protein